MSDEQRKSVSYSPGQAQDQEVITPEGDAGRTEPSTQDITVEKIEELISDKFQKEFEKRLQSLSDREKGPFVAMLDRRIDKLLEARDELAKGGHQISDEKFNQLVEQETVNALASSTRLDSAQGGGQIDPEVAETNLRGAVLIETIGKLAGLENFDLQDGDEEYSDIVLDGSAQEFIESVEKAALAKARRLTEVGPGERTPIDESKIARLPTLGPAGKRSNPLEGITDTTELWNLYKKSVAK